MEEKASKLEKLKNRYKELEEKHSLPSFKELNEDFHIEKISEAELEILIREIKKFIGDKLVNYMRFIESLLNPVNAPMFTLAVVKTLSTDERKKLENIYKELMKKEVRFIELDLKFSEEQEAKFIKESFKFWQEVKKDLLEILGKVDAKWSEEKIEINNKGYFG